jgi:biopolymer transport protein ExbD
MKFRSGLKGDRSPVFEREFRSGLDRVPIPLDSTAMLNVILFALLFYLVQEPYVLQPGIRLDLPAAGFSDGHTYDALIVAVTGERMVFAGDRLVPTDELPSVFAAAAAARPDGAVILEADRGVSHGTLMAIYDMAHRAGLRRIVLASRAAARDEDAKP